MNMLALFGQIALAAVGAVVALIAALAVVAWCAIPASLPEAWREYRQWRHMERMAGRRYTSARPREFLTLCALFFGPLIVVIVVVIAVSWPRQ